jgi:hypothetical protein
LHNSRERRLSLLPGHARQPSPCGLYDVRISLSYVVIFGVVAMEGRGRSPAKRHIWRESESLRQALTKSNRQKTRRRIFVSVYILFCSWYSFGAFDRGLGDWGDTAPTPSYHLFLKQAYNESHKPAAISDF